MFKIKQAETLKLKVHLFFLFSIFVLSFGKIILEFEVLFKTRKNTE